MLRVTLRGVRAHAVRFALSVLAVALGVAFVTGTFSLRTMLSGTFHGIIDASAPADVYVQGDETVPGGTSMGGGLMVGEQRTGVPYELADELSAVDGVDVAIADVTGQIVLVGADGTAVQSTQAPSFGLAFDERDPGLSLLDGRAPTAADEIAVESATLASSGLAIGDGTRVVLAGEVHEVTVVGEVDGGGPMAGATLVFLPVDVALATYAPEGTVSTIAVYGPGDVDEEALAATVGAALADGTLTGADGAEAVTGQSLRDSLTSDIDEMLGFVTAFLLIFAAISLFVGGYLITNTFAMSVRQRVREFALLRAVGASPAQVFGVVVGQAAVVGLVGSALGVAGGLGLVSVLRVGLEQVGMDLVGDIPLETSTVVLCLVLGTVVSMVAAAVPGRRAALVAPVEAMRGDVSVPERSLRLRGVLGGAVVALGALAVGVAALWPDATGAEPLLGLGAAVTVAGVLVAAPALARSVLRVLAVPFVRWLPPLGRLARGNVVRNPRRTASTAGALVIGMTLVGAVSVIAATGQASLSRVVESTTNADLVLRSVTNVVPEGAVDDVMALPEVGRADALAFTIGGTSPEPGVAPAPEDMGVIAAVGPGVLGGSVVVDVVAGDVDDLDDTHVVVNQRVIGEGWDVGDEVTAATAAGTRTFTVAAVIDTRVLGGAVLVTPAVLDELAPGAAQSTDTVFVDAGAGVTVDELRAAVADAVAPYVVVSVQDRDEFVDQMAGQVDQVLVILYALLGLSLVIAVLGIVNTLALSVIERTREIGLLRAVGLGRLQVAGVVTVESVLTAVFGTVVGLALGVGLASVLPRVYAEEGLDQLVVPWGGLGLMLALAVVVGVLAAVWPGARAARLRVLDAIGTPD
ncbi:ABC transporter permease [Cellulomonas wangsupingiae]|uniref:ABC transporter permease n=1 Tax=Cellulomonas wangsupingiae TaxID=2968085 RepID=UPI001D0F1B84|nr:ABC transporter permease [Cellulomonas wangsupingiae]MCM0639573.1 ABC transporter permease [Cellulomonas wangsupingiae]